MLFWWLTLILSNSWLTKYLTGLFVSAVFSANANSSKNQTKTAVNTTMTDIQMDWNRAPRANGLFISSLIAGTYEFESSVNFDQYLAELGVNFVLRKLAPLASPTVIIKPSEAGLSEEEGEDGDVSQGQEWIITTDTMFKKHQLKFTLGRKTADLTMDGRRIMTVISEPQPNVWVEVQESSNKKVTTIRREFLPEGLRVELKVNNVTATSFFRRASTHDDLDFMTK